MHLKNDWKTTDNADNADKILLGYSDEPQRMKR
jgi:hypothetical protein